MSHYLFYNPPEQYRGIPFWAWNGQLEDEELCRQIQAFSDMGMSGYFCHSRTGLETAYLSKEWFEKIRLCAEEGVSRGMQTWLYDEDRWPSGTCGGQVCRNPDYRMHFLRLECIPSNSWNNERLTGSIAGFSVNLYGEDHLNFSNKHRLQENEPPRGSHVLLYTKEVMLEDSFYNNSTYIDTMNPYAVQEFMRQTHEAYKEKLGDLFGGSIRGIFTDEPHRGPVMCGFGLKNRDPFFLTPFPYKLFEHFRNKYGYELIDFLPELFLKKDGHLVHPVKWAYMELLEELFLTNFLIPIHNWCNENHLLLTGHLLHEDNLAAQTAMIGSILRGYVHMDIPGIDTLFRHNPSLWIAKQIQSIARQCDKPLVLSEMYAGIGWDSSFFTHKVIGDWQALFGINLRCHHLSWYTMKGESKRDFPPSIHLQSAWYKHYHYVETYFARIGWFMQNGEPLCDMLVLSPVESLWACIHPGWCNSGFQACPELEPLEQRYGETFRLLCSHHIDFDYGDEALIASMGTVIQDNGNTWLQVGKSRYRRVLLTNMITIRSTTLRLLEAFKNQGGQVILLGEAPEYVDALPRTTTIPITSELPFVTDTLPFTSPLTVTDVETGESISCIYSQIRKDQDSLWIMLLNTDETHRFDVHIQLPNDGWLERWNPRDGSVHLMNAKPVSTLRHFFHESGELLLRLSQVPVSSPLLNPPPFNKSFQEVAGPFSYTLHEPNVLVLNRASWKFNGGKTQPDTEILRIDRQVRQQLGLSLRGETMVQPWYQKHILKTDSVVLGEIYLDFCFVLDYIPPTLSLAIECPQFWTAKINGFTHSLHPSDTRWVDSCFSVFTIDKQALQLGRNHITLIGKYTESLPLEALYLLGEFGVLLANGAATITPLPAQLEIGDIVEQGFPFYGGELTYHLSLAPQTSDSRCLETDGFGAACIHFEDKGSIKYLAFPPYTCTVNANTPTIPLTYSLTRRNTFGPLHSTKVSPDSCVPSDFVTEGEHFTPHKYHLIPAGMTHAIHVSSEKLLCEEE